MFDAWQRLFPLERATQPVTIVEIDEAALRRYGQWPWPRTRVAELIERIGAHRPAAIALDLFFPEPDRFSPSAIAAELPLLPTSLAQALTALPTNDERLAQALRATPVVLGIASQLARDPRFPAAPRAAPVALAGGREPPLASYAGHVGSVPVIDHAAAGRGLFDAGTADQVVRVAPLVARVQGAIVPALAVEMWRVAAGTTLRLAERGDGLLDLRIDALATRLQDDGRAWVRFGPHDEGRFVSAADVLDGRVDPGALHAKAVLVGVTGLGLQDFKGTPLGDFVPGVEVHAQIAENLFNGVWLARPVFAPWAEAAFLVAAALLAVGLLPRLGALHGVQLVAGLIALGAGASLAAFARWHVLLDPAWPAVGTLVVYGAMVIGSLSESDRQRRLLREQAARLAGEMDAARRIQMGMLGEPSQLAGGDARVSLAAHLEPARTVGGDFYDAFGVEGGRLWLLVADVSGKGLPAALFMAAAKSELKAAALAGGAVGDALTRAQAAIARENAEHLFVTVFAATLDLESGALDYANAGHEPPFVRCPGGSPERLTGASGPPLCVIDGFTYPTGRRTLVPGEWICMLSDGVTEAMNGRREFFTVERLRASLTWIADHAAPEAVVARVRDDLSRFAAGTVPADDVTLLVARWEGPSGR